MNYFLAVLQMIATLLVFNVVWSRDMKLVAFWVLVTGTGYAITYLK